MWMWCLFVPGSLGQVVVWFVTSSSCWWPPCLKAFPGCNASSTSPLTKAATAGRLVGMCKRTWSPCATEEEDLKAMVAEEGSAITITITMKSHYRKRFFRNYLEMALALNTTVNHAENQFQVRKKRRMTSAVAIATRRAVLPRRANLNASCLPIPKNFQRKTMIVK